MVGGSLTKGGGYLYIDGWFPIFHGENNTTLSQWYASGGKKDTMGVQQSQWLGRYAFIAGEHWLDSGGGS